MAYNNVHEHVDVLIEKRFCKHSYIDIRYFLLGEFIFPSCDNLTYADIYMTWEDIINKLV